MKKKVTMFVGYDSSQPGAYDVCRLSIQEHSKLEVQPVDLNSLTHRGYYWRDMIEGSTEFAFTRFLVPYLKGFYGYAIFCDSDFIWNCDPMELMDHINFSDAVSVVQHDILPEQVKPTKMNNKKQVWYPRKNWSSLMVFNCDHPFVKRLTPVTVSESPAGYLHEFRWCEKNIGKLPHTYNYLVGYYNDIENPKAIHFTDGGPWHPGYENVQFADKWMYYKNKVVEKYGSF